ncbi:hypothetical protein KCP69_21415 [Salmonella enterica subsp. enterica]|nr:hypothetical protein KCP69_21415 [Salmonella enterica subsp. enterica]
MTAPTGCYSPQRGFFTLQALQGIVYKMAMLSVTWDGMMSGFKRRSGDISQYRCWSGILRRPAGRLAINSQRLTGPACWPFSIVITQLFTGENLQNCKALEFCYRQVMT